MKNFKKAMKNFKKVRLSLGMKIIALLSCVALLSMGFASWWIVKLDTPTTSSGSFTAYDVIEKNINIGNFSFDKDTSLLSFGYAGTPNPNNKWLQKDPAMGTENLATTFTFDVSVTDNDTNASESNVNALINGVTMTITPDTSLKTALDNAIDGKVITAPSITYSYTGSDTLASSVVKTASYDKTTGKITLFIDLSKAADDSITVTIDFSIGWGDAFKDNTEGATPENPYKFYNEQTYSDTLADDAIAKLTLVKALNGVEDTSGGTPTYSNNFKVECSVGANNIVSAD